MANYTPDSVTLPVDLSTATESSPVVETIQPPAETAEQWEPLAAADHYCDGPDAGVPEVDAWKAVMFTMWTPECPAWCTLPTGHHWFGGGFEEIIRDHEFRTGERVVVEQHEVWLRGDVIKRHPVYIWLLNNTDDELTGAEACRFADDLLIAAHKLAQIQEH